MGIDTVNLGRIDLNLLVHLNALLTERSVTRAAARVGIGQSAMSHNLARLRELFGDELLTRGSDGMRLTPRAVTLLEPMQTMLAQVETLVSRNQAFDPATAVRTFRFGLPDSMEILIMPALLARMRARHSPPALQFRRVPAVRRTRRRRNRPRNWLWRVAAGTIPPQAAQAVHRDLAVYVQCREDRHRATDLARRLCTASSCADQPEARAQRARHCGRSAG